MSSTYDTLVIFRDQVATLDENVKRKLPGKLRSVSTFLETLNDISLSYSLTKASRSLVIGLTAVMKGLKKSDSNLGILSDDFDSLAEKLAFTIGKIALPKGDFAALKLLKWYIEISVMGVIGILQLSTKPRLRMKEAEEAHDNFFEKELKFLLFFESDYPRDLFFSMAESLGAKKGGKELIASTLEALALVVSIMMVSKQGLEEKNLQNLIPRLNGCLTRIYAVLTETKTAEEDTYAEMRTFLQQAKMSYELQDMDTFITIFMQMLKSYGFSEENLGQDIKAIQQMFDRFEEALKAKHEKRTMAIELFG